MLDFRKSKLRLMLANSSELDCYKKYKLFTVSNSIKINFSHKANIYKV